MRAESGCCRLAAHDRFDDRTHLFGFDSLEAIQQQDDTPAVI